MTVSFTRNFFANARGLTIADGGGLTWAFNQNTNTLTATGGGGGGTVTSVGLADGSGTAIYTVTGSPVIAAGTLTFTLNTQTANLVFAGPTIGAAAQPTFRLLVAADIPTIAYTGVSGLAVVAHTGAYSDLSGLPSIPAGANPSASAGLSAVNGSAATFLRSDGAPALSQAIAPTWTGAHTFTAVASVLATWKGSGTAYHQIQDGATIRGYWGYGSGILSGSAITDMVLRSEGAYKVATNGNTLALTIDTAQKATFASTIGINGVAPPTQVTGFGTPVGGAVVASYNITDAGGANSNTNKCVAEILTILKAYGMIGA